MNDTLNTLRAGKNSTELLKLFGDIESNKQQIRQQVGESLSDRALLTVSAEIQYAPYIEREVKEVRRREQYQEMKIPVNFLYSDMPGLSKELQQKLTKYRPTTIAQASLIAGMTPAAISLLIFKIRHDDTRCSP